MIIAAREAKVGCMCPLIAFQGNFKTWMPVIAHFTPRKKDGSSTFVMQGWWRLQGSAALPNSAEAGWGPGLFVGVGVSRKNWKVQISPNIEEVFLKQADYFNPSKHSLFPSICLQILAHLRSSATPQR